MSFQAMAWAINQQLPTHDKFVLLMIANYASNEHGDCYPSIGRLCSDTGLSKDSVIRAIKSLASMNLLTIRRRVQDGVNLPNVYTVHMGVVATSDNGGVVAGSDHRSRSQQGGVVAGSDSNQSLQPINEPIKSIRAKKTKALPKPEVAFDAVAIQFTGLTDQQKAVWAAAHPSVNVETELVRAACWLVANPSKQKSNYLRFLGGWLTRASAQASAPRQEATKSGHSALSARDAHRAAWGASNRAAMDRLRNSKPATQQGDVFDEQGNEINV